MIKKTFLTTVIAIGLCSVQADADALKDSLTNLMNKKDNTPGMVDLNRLNSNVKPVKPKTRSANTVIAIVNGNKIIKKDANSYIEARTQGQITDFDILPKEQQKRLISEISIPFLVEEVVNRELKEKDKLAIYTRMWMQKETLKDEITDEDVLKVYNNLKKRAEDTNTKNPIPEFNSIKAKIKLQMSERKVITRLTKDVNITVIDANMIAGSIDGIYVSIEEANRALASISKGKSTWSTIPSTDKERIIKMIAPNKLVEKAVKEDLSEEEKKNALSNFWMQNSMMKTKVSDEELKAAYTKIKDGLKKSKSKQVLPEFEKLKQTLHMQIAKEKVVSELMKNAKIKLK